ncbi:MAG: hypothetical protein IKY08_02175 [Firmicutes bacterium]|nr:hypothetical protein [Bacillota bacterium]
MMDKTASAIAEELKKIRGDQDKIQAYVKTLAETVVTISTDIATIATNTTPADAQESEPAAEPGEE